MELDVIFTREYGDGAEARLEIDPRNGRLYWKGEPVAIESLHLSRYQKIGATITVLSTAIIAAMAVLGYFWPHNVP